MTTRDTKEWLAYTYHNGWYNKGAFAPDYASMLIYANTKAEAISQAKDLFGRWGKVEFRQKTELIKV